MKDEGDASRKKRASACVSEVKNFKIAKKHVQRPLQFIAKSCALVAFFSSTCVPCMPAYDARA
jgi:hypothetical protein